MAMDYLHEDSADIRDDVWVIYYIRDAIVAQTHEPQLLRRITSWAKFLSQ